jgi:hypothetical protein
MTYYAGEYNLTRDITSYDYTLIDNLPNMFLWNKKTIYKKKFDPSTVNNDMTKAQVALREASPFSSLSFQVGIRFSLGKKSE